MHNSGIVDQQLYNVANSPFIGITGGTLQVGMKVDWNLSSVLQLHHLLTDMLPQVDPLICSKLGLPQIEKQTWWYLNGEEDHT